jgi:fibronectin-binding autotransporter adhesin
LLRLREASNGIVGGSTGSDRSGPINATGLSVWGHGFGSWGRLEGDREANTSDLKRSIGGVFVGVDGALSEDFRVGALGGYSRSTFKVGGRASNITTDTYQAGAYGGGKIGPVGVRFGAAYGWHKLDTDRTVAFTSFSDSLKANYKAHTAQAFGELAYRVDLNGGAFEPFADLAYVNLHTNRFTETGSAAALAGRSANADVTFSTLGLRIIKDIDPAGTTNLYTSMGWRRAFGDRTPSTTMSFASGGDAFSITGVPIARDAAVLEAGVETVIAKGLTLGAAYSGQLSRPLKAVIGWKF